METTQCPFCREEIKPKAVKCKHCGSMIVDVSQMGNRTDQKNGTLWLPLPSMIIGILGGLALFDDSEWDRDALLGLYIIATTSFILGVISINTQKSGKRMAIAGIVLSSIILFTLIGTVLKK